MSKDIKQASEQIDEAVEERTMGCPLCLKNASKYTCPRCNTPYCSVDCYRSDKHRDCSEGFYKDCFMEGEFKQLSMALFERFLWGGRGPGLWLPVPPFSINQINC
jgi:hypothetical protein